MSAQGADSHEDEYNLGEMAPFFKMLADQGNAEAQLVYAMCLERGEGVPRNLSEAARYSKMAADQGLADAQFNYGLRLERGTGVPRNLSEAARYYKMAADQGLADAQLNYGVRLERGEGVSRNLKEAAHYYKMAADQGLADGQFNYGLCLEEGKGVSRNLREAVRYYKMAVDQGLADAQLNYGMCLERGEGVSQNVKEAAHYYKMAADQGLANAQFNYGLFCERGEGVSQNVKEAAHYYKMAADQGFAKAQINYGLCLEHGKGVSCNPREAARYYKMAADQGFADGQYMYGAHLARGELVPRNLNEAVRYLRMAANQGNVLACSTLAVVEQTLTDQTVDPVKQEVKPLSEWLVDIGKLEEVNGASIPGGSESVRLFRRSEENGKVIVGKFVDADDSGDGEKQFKREIESLFSLHHPCIVKFVGYTLPCSSTDYRFLIFTDYLSGGSLSSVIENPARYPWLNSTSRSIIIVGIVLGMRYIHSRKILHRDLKPSNVLIDEKHHPRLCDFGSSRDFSRESTMTGLPPVTLYYAAPELCNEDGDYNEKIDVYSFGVMLYEIVTGKLALRHLNLLKLPVYISSGKRPEIPDSVLPFTRTLIERCWSQDPSERPPFEEIYNYLVEGDFRLFADVNILSISAYGESICDMEKAFT